VTPTPTPTPTPIQGARDLVIGVDLGTSGVRAVVADASLRTVAEAGVRTRDLGGERRDPALWWRGTVRVLRQVLGEVGPARIAAIAVDGTSGTLIATGARGEPLGKARLYDDRCEDAAVLERIAAHAPARSAAHGATSGLARIIGLSHLPGAVFVQHEADWIAARLSGCPGRSDENNALKSGYDPVARRWPDWIGATGARVELLPEVAEPGSPIGPVHADAARETGLDPATLVVAGTTDGCASFLATGAAVPGEGVSALGTTLTVKLLSSVPVFDPGYGIYSHRFGELWLAGGASNTGGRVLASFFDAATLARLSGDIDPTRSSGLDYYPLPGRGERFPINDPDLAPRLDPRPADDTRFLHGLLDGIAAIEALGYARLAELGAPALVTLRSVGGGAGNPVWSTIRQRRLGVPFVAGPSDSAALGSARLALQGARAAGAVLDGAHTS